MIDNQFLIEQIDEKVRAGRSPTEACRQLAILMGNTPDAQQALKEALLAYEEKTKRIRTLRTPTSLKRTDLQDWYIGPSEADLFWPALRQHWLNEKGWSESIVDSINDSSTKVISLMQPALRPEIKTRGLVIGYVQSGKTANYTAVIAKAADVGYRLFVVLSGMTNPLRNQTQERLETELVKPIRDRWMMLTPPLDDFSPGPVGNVNSYLTDHQSFRVLGVVKKNAVVLRRLLRWLDAATSTVLDRCPVLIIDDEADQASINASKYPDERTTINRLLLQMLERLPKSAYIAYTATPFANVFIDPEARYGDEYDLYPRDFIISLPRPAGYFGAERIFGRERLSNEDNEDVDASNGLVDLIRIAPEEDAAVLRPRRRSERADFEPEMAPSLEEAIRYFWLAAAVRAARGQQHEHMTMLVHTTLYTDVHDKLAEMISNYHKNLRRRLEKGSSSTDQEYEAFRHQWEREENEELSTALGETPTTFADLQPYLSQIVRRTSVITENSRSEERLSYEGMGRIQIVVGGNTLARGLTLEGLLVSFFIRAASAYDTLLQMGRWFGYRQGYADLTRMWLTGDLEGWFYDLATIEEEIRQDIERYQQENMTPLDFGIRVRTHPDLGITSRLKMQSAVHASVSYNNRRVQTVLFKHRDWEWLFQNIQAVRHLAERMINDSADQKTKNGSIIFQNVRVEHILGFLDEYKFHENNVELQSALLKGYIENQNQYGELLRWNVVIRSIQRKNQPTIDLGRGIVVQTLNRSRRNNNSPDAHIGVLMSRGDRVIDLEMPDSVIENETDSDLQRYRPTGIGLLVLYPISKDSPSRKSDIQPPKRLPLEAAEHVIGAAFVFPKSENWVEQQYMTVDLSDVEREEALWFEEEREEGANAESG